MKKNNSKNEKNYLLEISPLSLMETEKITQLMTDNQLFFASIENMLVVNRIIPKNRLIFTLSKSEIETDTNKTFVKSSMIGENLYLSGGNYYSSAEGFLIFEKGIYKILPVRKDASFLLKISDDSMEVRCSFFPAAEGYKNLTVDEILKRYMELKITATPDVKLITEYLKELEQLKKPINDVVIAEGTYPQPGKEGWIEYLVDITNDKKKTNNDNEKVDFYNLGTIISVAKDQKLAIVHPSIKGKAGVDVFGRIIPPEKVKQVAGPKGTNTYYDEKYPNILLSKIGGYLTFSHGKLSVSSKYNVKGNVDFHTGNISSKGGLVVKGDVRSGFKLDLDKSITINGFVNDAEIKSQGSITINGGFWGSGKGKISAAGDVTVRHVRNQSINADGDIVIMKEAVDSQLYAKGSVLSQTGQAIIIGGTTIAAKDVIVRSLGNKFHVKTKVQVGFDYELLEKSLELSTSIDELKNKLTQQGIRIKQFSNPESLSVKAKKRLRKIISEYQEIKSSMEKLIKEKEEYDNILNLPSQSKVKISGDIFPGVEIVIKKTVFKVTRKLRNKTFSLSKTEEGKIEIL